MEVTLTYIGSVSESGEIKLPGDRMRKELAKAFPGKQIELTVTRKKKTRSNPQNRYYWGVVVNILAHFFSEWNPEMLISPEIVHEWAKDEFLPVVLNDEPQKINTPDGEREIRPTTRLLTTAQFLDYIALIQKWASEREIYIPDPNEWEFVSVEKIDIDETN